MNRNRNGFDNLAFTNLVTGCLLIILATVLQNTLGRAVPALIGIALIAYSMFRVFSTNVGKRRYEEDRFNSIFHKNGPKPERPPKAGKAPKDPGYKTFKCPKCRTQCRVPAGRGKIKITCPACGEKFIKRS